MAMSEALNQFAMDSLTDSFETMAFLSPLPAEESHNPPADAVLITIRFTSNTCGVIEMVAGRQLGGLAASNMLGIDAPSPAECDDALKEMLNIFGGLMLRRWTWEARENIELSLPELREFDSKANWASFIASPGASAVDFDGNVVGIRIRTGG
jgi:hypothetical protein